MQTLTREQRRYRVISISINGNLSFQRTDHNKDAEILDLLGSGDSEETGSAQLCSSVSKAPELSQLGHDAEDMPQG